jgi:hypothetical protein
MYNPSDAFQGALSLPGIQRDKWAWTKNKAKKMETLIDSIMHNYPIPCIIVNQVGVMTYKLYDGRHRVETFWRYKNDEFTWKGAKYSELSEDDRRSFDERTIPVLITRDATADQLAEAFVRVNAGSPLKDSDLCWAYRHEELIRNTIDTVCGSRRLSSALGGLDMNNRTQLSNWVGLALGMSTQNAGNITGSFVRIQDYLDVWDMGNVQRGITVLCELYERANRDYPTDSKTMKAYGKIGYINAFFLAEWFESPCEETMDFWVDVIGRTRGARSFSMKNALKTTGAQNLNSKKIATVLEQVHDYIDRNIIPVGNGTESDDESN